MTPKISHAPWSEEALIAKAQLYAEKMESHTADDWQHGLWSTFVLELVARAALAHISPVLLADVSNWRNLTYALGHKPTAKKFTPASIPTTEVVARLEELVPEVTQEISGICRQHLNRRNAELHSGELIFSEIGTSNWLPSFYLALQTLLAVIGKELQDIVSDPSGASSMIEALQDEAAKAVAQDIKAHQKVWSNKSDKERETAISQAKTWATRHAGHRVDCPSCGSRHCFKAAPVELFQQKLIRGKLFSGRQCYQHLLNASPAGCVFPDYRNLPHVDWVTLSRKRLSTQQRSSSNCTPRTTLSGLARSSTKRISMSIDGLVWDRVAEPA